MGTLSISIRIQMSWKKYRPGLLQKREGFASEFLPATTYLVFQA